MSIDQSAIVDFLAIDKEDGSAVLTISDHLDWEDSGVHLQKLQDKINTYLSFCESGEIYKKYPDALGRRIVFLLVSKHSICSEGNLFLMKAGIAIKAAGFDLRVSAPASLVQ